MATESSDEATPTPGEQLRKARIGYSWSLEDVAGNLNLDVDVIMALETGDYAGLPEPAFIRGYLRAYARLMEIDEKRVLGADAESRRSRLGSVIPVMEIGALLDSGKRKRWPSFSQKQKSTRYRSVIIVVLVIAAILGTWYYSGVRLSTLIGANNSTGESGTRTITVPLNPTSSD